MKRNRGFTLVELLVTMGVITLLAMISVQSTLTALQMSRERHTESEILAMVDAVKLFKSDTGECVPGEDEADFRRWLIDNNFFDDVEMIDGWGRSYHIQIHCGGEDGDEYIIWASDGLDGIRGSDDDVIYLFAVDGLDGWTGVGAFD
jgi:prepilin-type N-terminal cleavage/methylation domain-containing protein